MVCHPNSRPGSKASNFSSSQTALLMMTTRSISRCHICKVAVPKHSQVPASMKCYSPILVSWDHTSTSSLFSNKPSKTMVQMSKHARNSRHSIKEPYLSTSTSPNSSYCSWKLKWQTTRRRSESLKWPQTNPSLTPSTVPVTIPPTTMLTLNGFRR